MSPNVGGAMMLLMAPTLLIVDDHDEFRTFARAMLAVEGFDVVGEAVDGASAIQAVQDLEPEIVLLDVVLPDMDGFAVCATIVLAEHPPIVVMTSSRDASSLRRRLETSAARNFIPKSELSGATLAAAVG